MFLNLLYCIGLIGVGFICSLPMLYSLSKTISFEYTVKKDVWTYMWLLSLVFVLGLYFILPDFHDMIHEFECGKTLVVFILSAFIYVAFLIEVRWLFYVTMAISSAIVTFLFPDTGLIFEGYLPFWVEKLIVFTFVFFITFFIKILNGMFTIFPIFVLSGLLGMSFISMLGGAPLFFGLLASLLIGMWLAFLRFNYFGEIALNEGACASAGFLLAVFFVQGAIELSGPSMLVLLSYLVAEVLWVLIRRFLWRIKEQELYYNTAYFVCYTKDITSHAIIVSIVKIGIINVIFSCFQLYAPNPFSIPVFALAVNLWLLNILYHASENNLSFSRTNENFFEELKNEFNVVKETLKRRK